MQPLNIRIALWLSVSITVIGILLLVLGFIGDQTINFFSGPVLAILGICMIFVPTVKISRDELKLLTPIGLTTARYPVRFPGDLALVDGKLWHVPTNNKIISLKFGYRKGDVNQLVAQIYGSQGSYQQGNQQLGYAQQQGYAQQAPQPPFQPQANQQWHATPTQQPGQLADQGHGGYQQGYEQGNPGYETRNNEGTDARFAPPSQSHNPHQF